MPRRSDGLASHAHRADTAAHVFTPMVADPQRTRIRHELKWLNAHLGAVRDLEVAVERLGDRPKATAASAALSANETCGTVVHGWRARCGLRKVGGCSTGPPLGSRMDPGPRSWETRAERVRALPIGAFSYHKLAQWQHKLVKKSRNLWNWEPEDDIGCALETRSSATPFLQRAVSRQDSLAPKTCTEVPSQSAKISRAVERRWDPSLARASGVKTSLQLPAPKREGRLIKVAAAAYRKLAGLEATVKP
jgi:hypothetical protein